MSHRSASIAISGPPASTSPLSCTGGKIAAPAPQLELERRADKLRTSPRDPYRAATLSGQSAPRHHRASQHGATRRPPDDIAVRTATNQRRRVTSAVHLAGSAHCSCYRNGPADRAPPLPVPGTGGRRQARSRPSAGRDWPLFLVPYKVRSRASPPGGAMGCTLTAKAPCPHEFFRRTRAAVTRRMHCHK